jgi:hypothetical protein
MSFYRRRPAVNPNPVGGGNSNYYDNETYEEKLARSCRRCGLVGLVYVETLNGKPINNLMCPSCGWQPIIKKEKVLADSLEDTNEEDKK